MLKEKRSYSFHCLLHTADLIQDHLHIRLAPLGISSQQARVIKALGFLGPISQIELAREFGITAASMSTMTSRLIALELIAAEKDALNAKRNLLSLTDKSKALLDDIDRAWASTDAVIEESIGQENMQELTELTRQLRDALGGRKPGAG